MTETGPLSTIGNLLPRHEGEPLERRFDVQCRQGRAIFGVEVGVFDVRPASDGSAYKEYVLTEQGREVFPIVVSLRQWGERHRFGAGEAHSQLIELATRRPLPYMQPLDAAGHALASGQTVVLKLA